MQYYQNKHTIKKIKKNNYTILLLLVASLGFGQLSSEYLIFTAKADSLYKAKDYLNSGLAFSKAFKSNNGKGAIEDRYYSAKTWSMAKNADSSFFQLFRIVEKTSFKDYDRITKETDFTYLHEDQRWRKLLDLIKQNKLPNFGFERITSFTALPNPWFQWGTKDYILRPDSTQKHSGKFSFLLEPTEDIKKGSFGCVAQGIPPDFEGNEIEVRAYIKMQNVVEPIGLMIRVDGQGSKKNLGFDNMTEKRITGTKDWTLYSVKVPLSEEASMIYIGAILSGTGKLWVDDFQVLIDGKDISEAKLKKK